MCGEPERPPVSTVTPINTVVVRGTGGKSHVERVVTVGTPSIVLSALLGVVACALLAPVLPTPAAAAASSHDGACVGDTGVTVVVDATNVGAGIRVQCALGAQANGWEALKNAGHTVAPIPIAAGAVCQIDGYPPRAIPPVGRRTSGATTTHRTRARAPRGRSARRVRRRTSPRPGSVEGWKYTSTSTQKDPPGAGPVFAAAVPPTTPPPTAPPASTPPPVPAGGSPKPGAGPSVASGPVRAGSGRHDRRCADDRRGRTGRRRDDQPAEHRDRRRGRVRRRPDPHHPVPTARDGRALGGVDLSSETHASSGFPFAMLVGIALIVAFATSAGVVAFRRRDST